LGKRPFVAPLRYGRSRPKPSAAATPGSFSAGSGELIHIDVKKLGRIHAGAGHRFIGTSGQRDPVAKRTDADGITTERLITDNGSAYRSTIHAIACRTLGIRHLRTRPQTNGNEPGRVSRRL
jgi:hypothetical protein